MTNGPELCDGAPPLGKTCLDYGYDRGLLGCSALCGPFFDGCDETGWRAVPSQAQHAFAAIWGSGPSDVFAVGPGGTIVHWDGRSWSEMVSGTTNALFAVWGSGPDNVYVAGDKGTLLRWDGMRWSLETLNGLPAGAWSAVGVWGIDRNNVFVIAGKGIADLATNPATTVVLRWSGSTWSEMQSFPGLRATAIWGTDIDNIFVGGESLFHWDGVRWSKMSTPPGDYYSIASIWGSSRSDVFAVADSGFIFHWDGTAWLSMNSGFGPDIFFSNVWGAATNDVFASGFDNTAGDTNRIIHWDGFAWSSVAVFSNSPLCCYPLGISVWGSSRDDVFVAEAGIRHWDGTSWYALSRNTFAPSGLWAADADHVFFASQGLDPVSVDPKHPSSDFAFADFWRWTGDSLIKATLSGTTNPWAITGLLSPSAIWGSGASDVFFVTPEGIIVHWDGSSWTQTSDNLSLHGAFVGIGGSSPSDVFVVGNAESSCSDVSTTHHGIVSHWNGASWSMPVPIVDGCLKAVWVAGPGNAFAVGLAGIIEHWDGTKWSAMNSGSSQDLLGVWGSGARDVFAVGSAGAILRYDGANWTAMKTVTTSTLFSVQGSGKGDVFTAGPDVLLHLRLGTWESIALPFNFSAQTLAVTPSRVFVGGGDNNGGVVYQLDREGVTCVGPETNCSDGWDNDCDGLVDAADPDCAGKVPEQCANLVDDDQDGKTDCADPDCAQFPACKHR